MKSIILAASLLLLSIVVNAQNYNSGYTGAEIDAALLKARDSMLTTYGDSIVIQRDESTLLKSLIWKPYNTAGTAPVGIWTGEYDFGGGVYDHATFWGYNVGGYKANEARGYWSIEGNYFNGGNTVLENYFEIYDSTGLLSWRPFQIAYYRKNNYLSTGLVGNKISIGNTAGTNVIDIYTDSIFTNLSNNGSAIIFQDSTALRFTKNNKPFLFQDNSGGSPTELIRLNNENDLEIGTTAGTFMDLVLNRSITSKYSGAARYGSDTGMVWLGNFSNLHNGFALTTSAGSASMVYNASTKTFRFQSVASGSPTENWNAALENYPASIWAGTINAGAPDGVGGISRGGISLGYNVIDPSTVNGVVYLFNKWINPDAELIAENDKGEQSKITGSPIFNGGFNYAADTSSSDDYDVVLPEISALVTGLEVTFKATTANTGGATLTINGLTQTAITKASGGAINTPLATGDILAGQIVKVVYDGTQFQVISRLAQ